MIKGTMNAPYKHAMLDLETLSVRNDACIIQIALVPFELTTGVYSLASFSMNVSREDCERYGLSIMSETVQWWMTQDKEVWASTQVDPQPLDHALDMLSRFWVRNLTKDAKVWSHSVFDIPVIETAFTRTGIQVPWNFRQPMDIRTFEYLTDSRKSDYPEIANSYKHNALADCLHQIEYLHKLYRKLQ